MSCREGSMVPPEKASNGQINLSNVQDYGSGDCGCSSQLACEVTECRQDDRGETSLIHKCTESYNNLGLRQH